MLAIADALKTTGLEPDQIKFELFRRKPARFVWRKQEMAKRSEGQAETAKSP